VLDRTQILQCCAGKWIDQQIEVVLAQIITVQHKSKQARISVTVAFNDATNYTPLGFEDFARFHRMIA
jgi:hypothetical protein